VIARRLAAVLVVVALPALAGAQAPADDTPAARREAAMRYLAAVPVESMLDDMTNGIAQQVQPDRREEFVTLMKKLTPVDRLKALTLEGVARHFTVTEIDALTRFYGSPEGKSIMKKFGPYMGELMPQIQAEVLRALQKVKEEMKI
jgi:hypothetical protein